MKTITKYAKENRKKMTPAEKRVAILLKKWGVRYRSQRMFDFYIVDFLIPDRRLIIEVDGKYHLENKEKDIKRENYLKSLGLNIIRRQNEQVLNGDCEDLLKAILQHEEINIRNFNFKQIYGTSKY